MSIRTLIQSEKRTNRINYPKQDIQDFPVTTNSHCAVFIPIIRTLYIKLHGSNRIPHLCLQMSFKVLFNEENQREASVESKARIVNKRYQEYICRGERVSTYIHVLAYRCRWHTDVRWADTCPRRWLEIVLASARVHARSRPFQLHSLAERERGKGQKCMNCCEVPRSSTC